MCGHLNLFVNQNIYGTSTLWQCWEPLLILYTFSLTMIFLGCHRHLGFFVGGAGDESKVLSVSEVSGMECGGGGGGDPMDCVKCLEG